MIVSPGLGNLSATTTWSMFTEPITTTSGEPVSGMRVPFDGTRAESDQLVAGVLGNLAAGGGLPPAQNVGGVSHPEHLGHVVADQQHRDVRVAEPVDERLD